MYDCTDSMEVGIRHPETRVDVSLDSHFIHYDAMLSSGVRLNYLTNEMQKKWLALGTEINKHKKSVNLHVSNFHF